MQSRIKPKNKQNFFQKFLILLYFGFFSINCVRANPITLEGLASAIDGDTIIVNNYKIRLNGVSAPELSEEGGNEAKQAMQKILENKTIKCSLSGRKSYERSQQFVIETLRSSTSERPRGAVRLKKKRETGSISGRGNRSSPPRISLNR